MDHLQSFIADCDRRTEVAKKRLAETQEEISAEVAAKVRIFSYFIGTTKYRFSSLILTFYFEIITSTDCKDIYREFSELFL